MMTFKVAIGRCRLQADCTNICTEWPPPTLVVHLRWNFGACKEAPCKNCGGGLLEQLTFFELLRRLFVAIWKDWLCSAHLHLFMMSEVGGWVRWTWSFIQLFVVPSSDLFVTVFPEGAVIGLTLRLFVCVDPQLTVKLTRCTCSANLFCLYSWLKTSQADHFFGDSWLREKLIKFVVNRMIWWVA